MKSSRRVETTTIRTLDAGLNAYDKELRELKIRAERRGRRKGEERTVDPALFWQERLDAHLRAVAAIELPKSSIHAKHCSQVLSLVDVLNTVCEFVTIFIR